MRISIALQLSLIVLTMAPMGRAAEVTWSTPFEVVSDLDIDLSFGPVVYAQNGGDNIGNEDFIPAATLTTIPDPKPVTIGGQTIHFEGIDAVYGLNASFGMIGFPFESFGDAVDHLAGQSFNVTFAIQNERTVDLPQVVFDPTPATLFDPPEERDYSISTGNADLDSILNSQVFMDSRNSLGTGIDELDAGTLEIYLNNLSVGTAYQVQIIGGADDRRFASDPMIIDPNYLADSTSGGLSPIGTLSDGHGNTVENVGAFLDLDGDDQGHVTSVLGTFTADSTTQQIDLLLQRGRNVGISAIILTEAASGLPGDFNGDLTVDLADYTVWRNLMGSSNSLNGNGEETGDSQGIVDAADYALWKTHFGETSLVGPVPPAMAEVPEPSTIVVLATSLVLSVLALRSSPRGV